MSFEYADVPTHAWKAELSDRMEQILNRKRSSVAGREETMTVFAELLMHHYAQEDLQTKSHELVLAILKSVKEESDEKETVAALRGTRRPRPKASYSDISCSTGCDRHNEPL